jgi:hypothetical protein
MASAVNNWMHLHIRIRSSAFQITRSLPCLCLTNEDDNRDERGLSSPRRRAAKLITTLQAGSTVFHLFPNVTDHQWKHVISDKIVLQILGTRYRLLDLLHVTLPLTIPVTYPSTLRSQFHRPGQLQKVK